MERKAGAAQAVERRNRSATFATSVFSLALAVAVPLVFFTNRQQWFFLDDWDFLAARDLRNGGDLLRPHNEHLTALPIVLYRLLFRVVGLNHYWPYQTLVILAHLSAAALLFSLMRRASVQPWIATAAGVVFIFLGSGRANLGSAFQVTFSGALAFGLAHLLLSDHEGFDRSDVGGLICGFGAVLCSGIGVVMVAVVGAAVLVRRGWQAALAHTAPLAAMYALWQMLYGDEAISVPSPTVRQVAAFSGWALWDSVIGYSQVRVGAALLLILFLIGFARVARGLAGGGTARGRYAGPAAMAGGSLLLVVVAGVGRASFTPIGSGLTPSRYVHLVVALLIPIAALGADAVAKRWQWSLAPAVFVLLVGLPGNLRALTPSGQELYTLGSPEAASVLAAVATELGTPASVRPDPYLMEGVTAGWLQQSSAAGRIPQPTHVPDQYRRSAEWRLSLDLLDQPRNGCRSIDLTAAMTLAPGDVLTTTADDLSVTELRDGRPQATSTFHASSSALAAIAGVRDLDHITLRSVADLTVRVVTSPSAPVLRCGPG